MVIAWRRVNTHGKLITIILLLGVFLLALAVRAYRMYPEFYSSDMMQATSLVTDAVPWDVPTGLWPQARSTSAMAGNLLLLLGYVYSPLTTIAMLANAVLLDRLGVAITETGWLLPTMIAGAGTVVLAYFLGKHMAGWLAGVLGAAFLMFLPIHVLQSRYAAAGDTLGFFLQGLTLYTFLRYLEARKRDWALATGVLLGISFYANLQWPAMLPVLAYAALVANQQGEGVRRRVAAVASALWRWELLLPSGLALTALFGTSIAIGTYQGASLGGPLGHFVGKTGMGQLDFYVPYYARFVPSEAGPALAAFFPFFLLLGVVEAARLRRASAIWFWSVCFVLPYWVFVGPRTTFPSNYYGPGLQAMALYAAIRLSGCMEGADSCRRALVLAVASLIVISSIYGTLITAYGFDGLNVLRLGGATGTFTPSRGYKAAGYWLRRNTPANAKVFAFEYGGIGLEPNVATYYFDRATVGLYDAPGFKAMLDYLHQEGASADYLVIRPSDYERLGTEQSSFPYRLAQVRDQEGSTLLEIYGRQQGIAQALVDDREAARQFDAVFGHLASLRGERKLALQE